MIETFLNDKHLQEAQTTRASAADRVAWWLLNGPAQLTSSEHAGGVAGVLDAQGRPQYVYPEDTGYYLQWLSWYTTCHPGTLPAAAQRARAAQRWLGHWATMQEPQTRVYLDGTTDDWRNSTRFTFDTAMALRGLATAAECGLLTVERDVVAALCQQLDPLINADGTFEACLRTVSEKRIPQRWSTTQGPFLAKAASGIMNAAQRLPGVSDRVRHAASLTFDTALAWAKARPHDEVHPLLYTFEGILSVMEHPRYDDLLRLLVVQYDDLLSQSDALGWIPESRSEPTALQRTDVIAQTIRVGSILEHIGARPADDRLAVLRGRLAACVPSSGAVPFAISGGSSLPNVWAAMFASQALPSSCTLVRESPAGSTLLLV